MVDVGVEFPDRSCQTGAPTVGQRSKLELSVVVVDWEQIPWWLAQIHSHIYNISAVACFLQSIILGLYFTNFASSALCAPFTFIFNFIFYFLVIYSSLFLNTSFSLFFW